MDEDVNYEDISWEKEIEKDKGEGGNNVEKDNFEGETIALNDDNVEKDYFESRINALDEDINEGRVTDAIEEWLDYKSIIEDEPKFNHDIDLRPNCNPNIDLGLDCN